MHDPHYADGLREQDFDADPVAQFADWFRLAGEAGVTAPESVAVASASAAGLPSVRMVLLKHFDEHGFVFFTNYASRKGQELTANPQAALLFYWEPLGRQVRIEGSAHSSSPEQTAAYVRSRPRGSQISALASPQSQVIESRETLEERVRDLEGRYPGEPPIPETWGGFVIEPASFEFWQHRADRLHDRLRYRRDPAGEWRIERLAP